MPEKKLTAIRKPYTKVQLHAAIAEETGLHRAQVAEVFDALSTLVHRHLKKHGAGEFTLPGVAKFKVSTRKATRERRGVNPFTGEPMTVAARPQRRIVRIKALKALKDMAES
ncbi:MAG: HU family DNA-binding protein [Acidobacteriota bacterium]